MGTRISEEAHAFCFRWASLYQSHYSYLPFPILVFLISAWQAEAMPPSRGWRFQRQKTGLVFLTYSFSTLLRITERRLQVPQVHFDGGHLLVVQLINNLLFFSSTFSFYRASRLIMRPIYDFKYISGFETTELLYSSKQARYLLSHPSI